MKRDNKKYMFPVISPSILSSDFGNIRREILKVYEAGARWFHFDIMDGSFVPPITFGSQLIESVRKDVDAYFDVHLMVQNPINHIGAFCDAGADQITVHYESSHHLQFVIDEIHKHKMDAGVVLNPATPVSVLSNIITSVDLVLIMSVNPGWGGQPFIEKTYERLAETRHIIAVNGTDTLIEVDGGVNEINVARLAAAGAQVIVAGSSIYESDDPAAAYSNLTRLASTLKSA